MEPLARRKYIRLPPDAYANVASIFFITIDGFLRQPLFSREDFNVAVISQPRSLAEEKRCPVKIYCLMPTHLHMLISPGLTSLIRWIALFKQRSQHLASQSGIPKLWQRSFFDHRIRSTESLAEIIEYIRANPVRAGLVEHPDEWRWTGSVVW